MKSMAVVIINGLVLMSAGACAPKEKPAVWEQKAYGQQLLRPFANAPFPHPSRAQGYVSKEHAKTYPYAGHYDDSTVGIVIPNGYRAGDEVNYVIHFHGHGNHVAKVLTDFKLGEQLAASKVNAILLIPQGPKDAADGGDGKLELEKDGLKRLVEEVTGFLHRQGKIETERVGKIALSAHSAGYRVTAAVLDHGGMDDHITDVMLLDASHRPHADWFAAWCGPDKGRRLVAVFTPHLKEGAQELMGLLEKGNVKYDVVDEKVVTAEQLEKRGVTFVTADMPHNDVPVKFFGRLVETSAGKDGQVTLMNLPVTQKAVCPMLRTKTAYGTYETPWQEGKSTTAVYWCLETMQVSGPDEKLADPQACGERRECFRKDES